jgi:hypothetical protein
MQDRKDIVACIVIASIRLNPKSKNVLQICKTASKMCVAGDNLQRIVCHGDRVEL